MNKNSNLWLIRVYAVIILIVLFGDFLEGAAYNLVIAIAAGAIIASSFFLNE